MARSNDRTDNAIEQVNDAVEDGGGCTEAWEALSDLRESTNSNRRNFLKNVTIAGVGGLGLMSGVAAGETTGDTNDWGNFEIVGTLSGDDALKTSLNGGTEAEFIRSVMESDEYVELKNALAEAKSGTQLREANVVRVKLPDGNWRYLTQFKFESKEPNRNTEIAISLDNGPGEKGSSWPEQTTAMAEITDYSDGLPSQKQIFAYTSEGIAKETVNPSIESAQQYVAQVQGIGDLRDRYCGTPASRLPCDGCKLFIGLVNAGTCGGVGEIASATICAAVTSATVIGPFLCAGAVGAVCFVVLHFSNNPQKACRAICAC